MELRRSVWWRSVCIIIQIMRINLGEVKAGGARPGRGGRAEEFLRGLPGNAPSMGTGPAVHGSRAQEVRDVQPHPRRRCGTAAAGAQAGAGAGHLRQRPGAGLPRELCRARRRRGGHAGVHRPRRRRGRAQRARLDARGAARMSGRAFIDTAVLVSLFDGRAPERQQAAGALLQGLIADRVAPVVSTHVLQETCAALTGPLGLAAVEALASLQMMEGAGFIIEQVDVPLVWRAAIRSADEDIAFRDALVVETARTARCGVLYSEGLPDGRAFDGVKVRNPFVTPAA
nr:MAG: hypothetical protein DIU62_05965 [Pseudomonadota bacterium]